MILKLSKTETFFGWRIWIRDRVLIIINYHILLYNLHWLDWMDAWLISDVPLLPFNLWFLSFTLLNLSTKGCLQIIELHWFIRCLIVSSEIQTLPHHHLTIHHKLRTLLRLSKLLLLVLFNYAISLLLRTVLFIINLSFIFNIKLCRIVFN